MVNFSKGDKVRVIHDNYRYNNGFPLSAYAIYPGDVGTVTKVCGTDLMIHFKISGRKEVVTYCNINDVERVLPKKIPLRLGDRYYCLMRPHHTCLGLISFTSSMDPEEWVECEVVEEHYQGFTYKVELRAVEPGYGKETFYVEDFRSLIDSGHIVPIVRNDMHVVKLEGWEHLCGAAYIVHTGTCICAG